MFSQTMIFLYTCYLSISAMPMTIYNNAKFVPFNSNDKLVDLSLITSQSECACRCLNTTKCFTATFISVNQTCTLFFALLRRDQLKMEFTMFNSSVLTFRNKTFPNVNFTQMSVAIPQSIANYSYLNAVAIGYLNGDSVTDLAAVYRQSNNLVVWMGNGNGTFVGGTPYATSVKPYDLSITDLTGDGQLDIIVMCYAASELNLFINQGSGIFFRKQITDSTGSSSYPVQMTLADIDGNGLIDIVTADIYSPYISSPALYSTVGTTAVLNVVDVNRDGFSDLLLLSGSTCYTLLLGNATGSFITSILCGSISTGFATGLAVEDVNNDGILDMAIGATGTSNILILLGSIK
ncbi:hypothetical protein I4U23_004136 [Adineta vaga]|nr:hypothetical protein I4U23_004136 [Adineta vaga]